MFSASHLANVGISAYIEDLAAAKKRITGGLGRDIYFSSAPPMLLSGTGNSELITNITALVDWVSNRVPEEVNFISSSRVALDVIIENGRGGSQTGPTTRMRLPVSLDGHDKKIWAVCSSGELPNRMGPLSSDQEGRIVVTLIGELKQNLALELDPTPKSSRSISSRGELGATAFLVVGSIAMPSGMLKLLKLKVLPPGLFCAATGGQPRRALKTWRHW